MDSWIELKTECGVPMKLGLPHEMYAIVSIAWGDRKPTEDDVLELRRHAVRAIEIEYELWCEESGGTETPGALEGEVIWTPQLCEVQPTHVLHVAGKRIGSVCPVNEVFQPEQLGPHSYLATREQWSEGLSPSYRYRNGMMLYDDERLYKPFWHIPVARNDRL